MSVGKRLAQERKRIGFDTQDRLAKTLSVTLNTVSRWETEKNPIPSNKLLLMRDLGIDVLYILLGDKTASTETPSETPSQTDIHDLKRNLALEIVTALRNQPLSTISTHDVLSMMVVTMLVDARSVDAYHGFQEKIRSGNFNLKLLLEMISYLKHTENNHDS